VGHHAEIRRWLHALLAKRDRLAAAVTSFVMLSVALKSLPVGTAYAVWVGIGVFGVAIAGMIALGESVSVVRLTFLTLILAGIIGLKMVEA
jgi:quaternary ammonium compound-resistance protein SugE